MTGAPGGRRPAQARWAPTSTAGALIAYAALAVALTWPLATALTRSLPSDLGDPALNAWILAWSAEHLRQFAAGHLDAFTGYWNANIFHPEPLALAYSEHLFAQALQVLPVWAVTRNPILCYNLAFLSTFAIAGTGMYLLVRDLTGDARAAFVAGIAYAFAPYRIAQMPHLQVLSSGWMPLTLFALRRHLSTGGLATLAGFATALLLQNLSCGYYTVFFFPFVAAYAIVELGARRLAAGRVVGSAPHWRSAARVGAALGVVALATWPFLSPYLELRRLGFPPRGLPEVISFSANVWSYLQAPADQWLWGGRLALFPKAEGELFPGVVAPALAAVGLGSAWQAAWRESTAAALPAWRRTLFVGATAGAVVAVVVAALVIARGGWVTRHGPVVLRVGIDRVLRFGTFSLVALLVSSPRVRGAAARFARTPAAWFAVGIAVALVLSLGPAVEAGPRTLVERAPYRWLYERAPGFDGLRVPARYAMLAAFGGSVLAGLGMARLVRATRRPALVAAGCAIALIVEGGAAPIALDRPLPADGLATPPAALPQASSPPPVYGYVAGLAPGAVICELPFGSPSWDIRYVFATTLHGRRLVNGYSGGFPVSYYANLGALRDPFRDPAAAWSRISRSGTTHAIVHEGAYRDDRGPAVTAWLVREGARRVARFGNDQVLRLP